MFYFLSKTADVLLEPLWWSAALLMSGLVIAAIGNRPRRGIALALTGVAVLLLFSCRPVAHRLMHAGEAGVNPSWHPGDRYDLVVLLGGVVDHAGFRDGSPAYQGSVERLTTVYELLRTGRAKYVVASGGPASPGAPTEARLLLDQLAAWGIEPDRLIAEETARNTRENASRVAAIVEARGFRSILIVTSALHMPRASGCFRKVGLAVDTLSVDYRMRDPSRWSDWLPRSDYLASSAQVIRELGGRWVYEVLGYTR